MTELENKINALFDELVPDSGAADTVAGEIIRAVTRIVYRNWNDGDHIGVGYGRETCNPAARYLMVKCGGDVKQAVRSLWGVARNDMYDARLAVLEQAVIDYLEARPQLQTMANHDDMWEYRDDNEDVDRDYDEDDW